jgi:2-dehydropantoate 2-reductase
MRILVVGAGAVGGYFGGRLLEAGRDVTFLVRPKRAERLARSGLVIRSRFGDALLKPVTILAEEIGEPYDLVLLSCKAYDLESAIDSCAPAVGSRTLILPLMNGMRHLDLLDARFGQARVLGGLCQIASNLDADGHIRHLNDTHLLHFGERDGSSSARVDALAGLMSPALFKSRPSSTILHDMWEKWVFLASLAGITCLMRAVIGDIVAAGSADLALELFRECGSIAEQAGFPPRPPFIERSRGVLTAAGSSLAASMLRDIERGGRIESDQIIGDLLARDPANGKDSPLLRLVQAHLRVYESARQRLEAGTA